MSLKRDKIYKNAPPYRDSIKLSTFRGKGKYWEYLVEAELTEFMDVGFLPDTKLHIDFKIGGPRRSSDFRIDIETKDFPHLLELMYGISPDSFRQDIYRMALRAMTEHPKDVEALFHKTKKHEAAQSKEMENGRGTETGTEEKEELDGDRSATEATE